MIDVLVRPFSDNFGRSFFSPVQLTFSWISRHASIDMTLKKHSTCFQLSTVFESAKSSYGTTLRPGDVGV
jgi:hypothetical protein